jgi:hypothetical protein
VCVCVCVCVTHCPRVTPASHVAGMYVHETIYIAEFHVAELHETIYIASGSTEGRNPAVEIDFLAGVSDCPDSARLLCVCVCV